MCERKILPIIIILSVRYKKFFVGIRRSYEQNIRFLNITPLLWKRTAEMIRSRAATQTEVSKNYIFSMYIHHCIIHLIKNS
jgi:hypothetical protein